MLISTSCSRNESDNLYNDAADKFNTIYFNIVKDLDTTDTIKTLEALQTDDKEKNVEQLSKLLKTIKENLPENKETLYDNSFKKRYEELVFLQNSYSNFNELSFDEKHKMGLIFISIGMNIENWKEKDIQWK